MVGVIVCECAFCTFDERGRCLNCGGHVAPEPEARGPRVAAALERRLRHAPEVARHVEDAVHVVEVLRRWYGPNIAKDVLRAALELAEVSS